MAPLATVDRQDIKDIPVLVVSLVHGVLLASLDLQEINDDGSSALKKTLEQLK